MNKLKGMTDQAEVFYQHGEHIEIPFLDGQPGHINLKMPENVAVRVFKNNKCGFAYTSSLKNREVLIKQAMTALEFGTDAAFRLPEENTLPPMETYDESIDDIDPAFLIREASRVIGIIKQKNRWHHLLPHGQVQMYHTVDEHLRIGL